MMCATSSKIYFQLTNPRHMDHERKRGEYEKVKFSFKYNMFGRFHLYFDCQATQMLAVLNRVSTSHLRFHWSLDFILLNYLHTSDTPVIGCSPLELLKDKMFTATEGDLNVLRPYLIYVVQVLIIHTLPWEHLYAPCPTGGPYNTLWAAETVQAICQVGKRVGAHFQDILPRPPSHKYSKKMAKASVVQPLGIRKLDPATNHGHQTL